MSPRLFYLDRLWIFHYDTLVQVRWIVLIILCVWPVFIWADEATRILAVLLPSGTTITAEVADTPPKRVLGLMFRDKLPDNHGMLFIFENPDFHGIWMKNCRIPLDILWLDQNRKVIHIEENVPPCQVDPCHTYYPLQKALYVLELNAGLTAKEKIRLGVHIQF